MMITLLPAISIALAGSSPQDLRSHAVLDSARAVQVELLEALSSADAIHSVTARRHHVAFAIDHDGHALRVVATTNTDGSIVALTIGPAGPALALPGRLSWLATELADATAITRLTIDPDGRVKIATSDGRAYLAIAPHGSPGNIAAEARWAAAWSDT